MKTLIVTCSLLVMAGAFAASGAELPVGPEAVTPLAAGMEAPAATVKTMDGKSFDLGAAFRRQPTVLIFYRGGWCPYCNRHLAALQGAEPKLTALGYQILAVCADKPEGLAPTIAKHKLTYTILSDREMQAASAFRVAYRLPPDLQKKYQQYGIDLAPIPGVAGGYWLPVPSVFIIGKDGKIRFVHSNPDFKVRIAMPDLLAAAEAAAK